MINIHRLTSHLQALSEIGRTNEGGVNRFSYTNEEKLANELVKKYMETAGLTAARSLHLKVTELQRVAPVPCDESIQDVVKDSIREIGESVVSLPSGAGHDGMQFKDRFPVAMIFVRSKDGIGHNPKEFSSAQDIEKAANVLYKTVLKLDAK